MAYAVLKTKLPGTLPAQIAAHWHRARPGHTAADMFPSKVHWHSLWFLDTPDSRRHGWGQAAETHTGTKPATRAPAHSRLGLDS